MTIGDEVTHLQAIWKFPLLNSEWTDHEMPEGAEVIHVDEQHGTICVWALVTPHHERVTRRFRVIGTGWPILSAGAHVGSVISGQNVWHVFEVPAP